MKIEQYRKRPVVIEAVQYDGSKPSRDAVIAFMQGAGEFNASDATIQIKTLEGTMVVGIDDWVIKGVANEFYPCKDSIFRETYELVQ